ncbi:hypothetical protein F5883DRAFT_547494, partial [Diaporthe sp. PMI_573]
MYICACVSVCVCVCVYMYAHPMSPLSNPVQNIDYPWGGPSVPTNITQLQLQLLQHQHGLYTRWFPHLLAHPVILPPVGRCRAGATPRG